MISTNTGEYWQSLKPIRVLFLFILSIFISHPAHGQDSTIFADGVLTVGAGAFDVTDGNSLTGEGFVSYHFGHRGLRNRFGEFFRGVGPMIGLKANTDGGIMGHGSLFLDLRPSRKWVLWPSAGLGGYRKGDSRHLGGVFQFHLGGQIGYRWTERSMLGVSLQHVSNAGLHDANPGADSVFLTYSITLN